MVCMVRLGHGDKGALGGCSMRQDWGGAQPSGRAIFRGRCWCVLPRAPRLEPAGPGPSPGCCSHLTWDRLLPRDLDSVGRGLQWRRASLAMVGPAHHAHVPAPLRPRFPIYRKRALSNVCAAGVSGLPRRVGGRPDHPWQPSLPSGMGLPVQWDVCTGDLLLSHWLRSPHTASVCSSAKWGW